MPKDLTTGSVFKNVLYFSLPYLLSYFLQTLYGMADLFIIGQFEGTASITAVSIGGQLMHMITVMLVGLAMGVTVGIGRAVGAHDERGRPRRHVFADAAGKGKIDADGDECADAGAFGGNQRPANVHDHPAVLRQRADGSSHRAGDEPDRGAGEPDSAGLCAVADKSGELKSIQIKSSEIK